MPVRVGHEGDPGLGVLLGRDPRGRRDGGAEVGVGVDDERRQQGFAGLWALLTVAPRSHRGLWELLLFHRGAITAYCFAMWHLPDAPITALVDLTVTVTTLIAYVLCRDWLA